MKFWHFIYLIFIFLLGNNDAIGQNEPYQGGIIAPTSETQFRLALPGANHQVVSSGLVISNTGSGFSSDSILLLLCHQTPPIEVQYLGGSSNGNQSAKSTTYTVCYPISTITAISTDGSGYASDSIFKLLCVQQPPSSPPYQGGVAMNANGSAKYQSPSICYPISTGIVVSSTGSGFATDSIYKLICSISNPAGPPYLGGLVTVGNISAKSPTTPCFPISTASVISTTGSGFATDSIFKVICIQMPPSNPPYQGGNVIYTPANSNKLIVAACQTISTGLYISTTGSGFTTDSIFNIKCIMMIPSTPPYIGGIISPTSNTKDNYILVACKVQNSASVINGTGSGYKNLFSYCGEFGPLGLPIELLDFWAQKEEDRVLTSWITETERNNELFTVEKTYDLQDWELVGHLPGAGNSQQQLYYSLYDENPRAGVQY